MNMIGGGRVTLSAVYITKLLILSKAQSAENNITESAFWLILPNTASGSISLNAVEIFWERSLYSTLHIVEGRLSYMKIVVLCYE